MAKSLVIVESPAKAKTIGKYLGKDFIVKASLGHVKDLPKKDLAVDVEHGFEPHYEVIEGKKKLIAELKASAKGVESGHWRSFVTCIVAPKSYLTSESGADEFHHLFPNALWTAG